MNHKIKSEVSKKIINLIEGRLSYNNGKILCLSLTGSRAFGWADERLDYDIHGIISCEDYWNWVHFGKEGFDINLYELSYVYTHLPRYLGFEFFQNISNPIYLDPDFDYRGLMSFSTPSLCTEPTKELTALEYNFKPRAALHCYRILMVPIYFLKNRKFELDIFKINQEYNFTMLPILKEAYLSKEHERGRVLEEKEKEAIRRDLTSLQEEFRRLKEEKQSEEENYEKLEKWKESVMKVYNSLESRNVSLSGFMEDQISERNNVFEERLGILKESNVVDNFCANLKGEVKDIFDNSFILVREGSVEKIEIPEQIQVFRDSLKREKVNLGEIRKGDKLHVYCRLTREGKLIAHNIIIK